MAQFIRQGNAYYRQDDSGSLLPVTDRDTLKGLETGGLPYNSVGTNRALTFGDTGAPKPVSGPPASTDVASLVKEKLVGALNNYKGVSDTTTLEAKRQELLRKQLLSSPYSAQGETSLTGSQKLSLLRDKGSEFEPEIKSIEEQILRARNGDQESLNTLSKLTALAKEVGIIVDSKRDTSITEVDGQRVLVDNQTGEVIKTLGSTKNETDSGLSPTVAAKVATIAQSFDSHPLTKQYNDVQNKVGSIKEIVKSGVGGPAELALVYEFMKALDPASVVRETEYDMAAKSGNIFAGALAKFNGYFKENGGFMPPQVQQAFVKIMESKYDIATKQYQNYREDQINKINKWTGGNDGADYLSDYSTVDTSSAGKGEKKESTISQGLLSNRDFVEKVLTAKGLDYNKVVAQAQKNEIPVVRKSDGKIFFLMPDEYNTKEYVPL